MVVIILEAIHQSCEVDGGGAVLSGPLEILQLGVVAVLVVHPPEHLGKGAGRRRDPRSKLQVKRVPTAVSGPTSTRCSRSGRPHSRVRMVGI